MKYFLCIALLISPLKVFSEELDAETQKALQQTLQMLQNSQLRQNAIKDSAEAQGAHNRAQKVMGTTEGTERLYGTSADIFKHLVESTKGDPVKLREILNQALQDPNSLKKYLKDSHLQQIKGLANEVESQKAPATK